MRHIQICTHSTGDLFVRVFVCFRWSTYQAQLIMLFTIRIMTGFPCSMLHLAIECHSNWFNTTLWYDYELNQSIAEVNSIGRRKLPWGTGNGIDWQSCSCLYLPFQKLQCPVFMPHLISACLGSEMARVEASWGICWAGRSSTHSHAYMWDTHTYTHIYCIPVDPSRQMEGHWK